MRIHVTEQLGPTHTIHITAVSRFSQVPDRDRRRTAQALFQTAAGRLDGLVMDDAEFSQVVFHVDVPWFKC